MKIKEVLFFRVTLKNIFIFSFFILGFILLIGLMLISHCVKDPLLRKPKVIFASYVESNEQLQHTVYMAESINKYADKLPDYRIIIYHSNHFDDIDSTLVKDLKKLKVPIIASGAPKDARWFYYGGKVFAASFAEANASNNCEFLVWMDEDTIVLRKPSEFILPDSIDFAYRPVMHNRSGSLFSKPPDDFWSRIYNLLNVEDESLFPMVTPGDQQTIRAYFNAGLLVVRPEKGILRKWAENFKTLYTDSVLIEMSKKDVTKRIFLHQTALVGLLNQIDKSQMSELPETYNYPIFFHQQYETVGEFCSIENIITLRYDFYFRDPDPEWANKLTGPQEKIDWLVARLGKK